MAECILNWEGGGGLQARLKLVGGLKMFVKELFYLLFACDWVRGGEGT